FRSHLFSFPYTLPSYIYTLSLHDALPIFTAQLDIIDPDIEGVGEIYVKGPMVTKGYYNNLTATTAAIHDHWLATGDLGYVDEERSEEHTSELQSRFDLVCRLLLEKKKK